MRLTALLVILSSAWLARLTLINLFYYRAARKEARSARKGSNGNQENKCPSRVVAPERMKHEIGDKSRHDNNKQHDRQGQRMDKQTQ